MLKIENVTKQFKNGKGIKNVSFEVPKGSICGFVGDNGMGKTTTIKCIFREYKLDEGKITYNGQELKDPSNLLHFGLFPDATAMPMNYRLKDYIYYQTMLYKIPKSIVEERFKNYLRIFGLEGYGNKRIKQLSSGMLKRAMLIGAMIVDCEYLVLDEPTSNLDVDSRKEFLEILKWMNEQGKTIIITSHIIEELQELINYLVFIDNGEIKYKNKINTKKERIIDIYMKHRTSNQVDRVGELKNMSAVQTIAKEEKVAKFPIFRFNFISLLIQIPLWVINVIFFIAILAIKIVNLTMLVLPKSPSEAGDGIQVELNSTFEALRLGMIFIYIATWIVVAGYELFYRQKLAQLFNLERRTGNKISNSYFSRVLPLFLVILINVTFLFIVELILTLSFSQFTAAPYFIQPIANFQFIYLFTFIFLAIYLLINVLLNPICSTVIVILLSFFMSINPLFESLSLTVSYEEYKKFETNEKAQKLTYNFQLSETFNKFFEKHQDINYLISDLQYVNEDNYDRLFRDGKIFETYNGEEVEPEYIPGTYEATESFKALASWSEHLKQKDMTRLSMLDQCNELIKFETNKDLKEFLELVKVTGIKAAMVDMVTSDFVILSPRPGDGAPSRLFGSDLTFWSILNSLRVSVQLNHYVLMNLQEYTKSIEFANNKMLSNPFVSLGWMIRGKLYNEPAYNQLIYKIQNSVGLSVAYYKWEVLNEDKLEEIKKDSRFRKIAPESEYKTIIKLNKFVNNPFYELFYFIWIAIGSLITYLGYFIFKKRNIV